MMYSLIPNMLSEIDYVVRVYSLLSLIKFLQQPNFNPSQFIPYLESSIRLVTRLITQAKDSSVNSDMLKVIPLITNRMSTQVKPYFFSKND